jgi:hypothetical protein
MLLMVSVPQCRKNYHAETGAVPRGRRLLRASEV